MLLLQLPHHNHVQLLAAVLPVYQGPPDQLTSFCTENTLLSSTEHKALLIYAQTSSGLHEQPDKTVAIT